MVVCDLDMVLDDGKFIQNVSSNIDRDIYNNEIKKYMVNLYPSAWNKLYKRTLFDNEVYFKKGIWFEDVEFIYRLIPYVRYLYATFIKQATNYKDKKEYDKAVDEAIKNVKEKIPKYRRNKYFYKSIKGIYLICFNKFIANIYYKICNR